MSKQVIELDISVDNYEELKKQNETRQLATVWYRLTTLFPTTPLIATVSGTASESEKQYGAFANGQEAYEWYVKQPWTTVRIRFVPLRNPNIKRTYNDFYNPMRHEDLEKEYDHTIREI